MSEYSYIITDIGLAKIATATSGGDPVDVTQIAVGDGNGEYYTPASTQTGLVNEVKRVDINNRGIDGLDPTKLFFIGKIPADDYGYAIRECALFDAVGDMIAVRKYPLIDKTAENNMIEVFLKEELIVTNTGDFTLTVDPNIILASQEYVENELSGHDTDSEAHYDVTHNTRGFMIPSDKKKLDELNLVDFVPYSVNYGNTDANGYGDIITKVSDTEVSFKVGGAYPNIGVTFPNGKHYVISSIANVTGLADNDLYTFVLFEENLVDEEDGTYSATVDAIQVGYTGNYTTPVMASDSEQGFDVFVRASSGGLVGSGSVYKLFDHNNGTGFSLRRGTTTDYVVIKKTDEIPFVATDFLWYSANAGTGTFQANGGTLFGSNNSTNGIDGAWTALKAVTSGTNNKKQNLNNTTAYKMYRFFPNISLLGGYSQGSCNYREISLWHDQDFAGGTITEDYTHPTSPTDGDLNLLINQKPLKPELRTGGAWVEKQFVKIGEALKDSGTLGDIITYAFNRISNSGSFSIALDTTYTFAYNLGLHPKHIEISGYVESLGQYRQLNNVGRASTSGNTGERGGDVVYQELGKVKLYINASRIHPSFQQDLSSQSPNNATTGTAVIIAKAVF